MILKIFVSIIIVIFVVVIVYINVSPQFGARSTEDSYSRIQSSKNFSQGKFRNITRSAPLNSRGSNSNDKGDKYPKNTIPVERINGDLKSRVYSTSYGDIASREGNVTAIWFGHSAVLLEIDNKRIFVDPMLTESASPNSKIGPKRFNYELPMSIDDIPSLDAVVISHDHYDHLDYNTIIKIKDKVKVFFVPLGVKAHLESWGVEKGKVIELDWWEESVFEGLTFVATPAYHFSGRGLFNRNSTLWCSWVIKNHNSSIFFSGDGSYSESFKDIGDKYGPFDLTLLECGQYNEAWIDSHMMPEDTVQAHIDLKGRLLMPIHWGAFKLSTHSWQEPVERAIEAAKSSDINITTPKIGEPVILNYSIPNSKWWIEEGRNINS